MPQTLLKEIVITVDHLDIAIQRRYDPKICTTCLLAVGIAMENNLPIGTVSVGFSSCSVFESIANAQDPNNYTAPRDQYDFTGATDIAATFDCEGYAALETMLPRTLVFTRLDSGEKDVEEIE